MFSFAGKRPGAMISMLAVFGEFEREMIVARVNAGLARAIMYAPRVRPKNVSQRKRGI